MDQKKSVLMRILRILSESIALISLLWWALGSSNEPQWLFYASLLVSLIIIFLDRGKIREQREQAEEAFWDLGRSPATYERAVRDREQRRFRLGAYRTTMRVLLSEETFLQLLRHRAQRLGFQDPEMQIEGDRRCILMKQARLFANAANRVYRTQPNMAFDITRLKDAGEVDVCAWASALAWVPCIFLAAVGCAFEVLAFFDKAPIPVYIILFLYIVLAAALMPVTIRFTAKKTLRDLQRQMAVLHAEDEP